MRPSVLLKYLLTLNSIGNIINIHGRTHSIRAEGNKTDGKVNILIYYESFCLASKMFILEEFTPIFQKHHDIMNVTFVPYGFSSHQQINGNLSFTCSHGEKECIGNKIHSCIQSDKEITDTEKVYLLGCLLKHGSDKSLDRCVNNTNHFTRLNYLRQCSNGNEGSELLAKNGDQTHAIGQNLKFLPMIQINKVIMFERASSDLAATYLDRIVCHLSTKKTILCSCCVDKLINSQTIQLGID